MNQNSSEFSFRAIIVGCLIGGIVCCMNVYIGLQVGWSFGASIISAILGYSIFQLLNPKTPYTLLENNITQTTGSAAGSMASASGLLAPIPALGMLGHELPLPALFIWALSIAYLGVMFAVPLREQYVIHEKLKFPSGLATADTIKALYASGKDAMKKARYLGYFALAGFAYTILAEFFPVLVAPNIHKVLNISFLTVIAAWGFKLYVSPALFSAGFLIGPRVGFSLIAGSIVAWSLAAHAQEAGWAPHPNPMTLFYSGTNMWGAKGWILWTGVAIMVSEALMSLALSYQTILSSLSGLKKILTNTKDAVNTPLKEDIPTKWWTSGLLIVSLFTTTIAYIYFDINPFLTIFAIFLSFLLSNVSVRSVGETDINPISGVGKVTQTVFGNFDISVGSNLMAAGITGGGASQAGDMMQDFKTGHIFGASPKKQFKAQLWGITAGIFFAVMAYYIFKEAYGIGPDSEKLPAPGAMAWKAFAEVMVNGTDSIPATAKVSSLIGILFGSFLALANKFLPDNIKRWLPSGLAFGISFIIGAQYSIIMFLGTVVWLIWRSINKESCDFLAFPVACGILAGDGMASLVTAIKTILG